MTVIYTYCEQLDYCMMRVGSDLSRLEEQSSDCRGQMCGSYSRPFWVYYIQKTSHSQKNHRILLQSDTDRVPWC